MILTITETSDGKNGYEAIFGEFSLSKIYLMHSMIIGNLLMKISILAGEEKMSVLFFR